MTRRLRIHGVRGRLLVAVLSALAAALVAATVAFNLIVAGVLSNDANNLLRSRTSAQLDFLKRKGDRLVVRETPDAGALQSQVWIFSQGQTLEEPRASDAVNDAAHRLDGGPRRFLNVGDTRLYAVPVVDGGQRLGTLVSGISMDPYEHTQGIALVGSLILTIVLLVAVGLAAYWLLGSALRPVARMTAEAEAWSETDLDRRFELGEPHDELTQLAATLDGLLDRLAASLRREQRFSAELSHELRTPLAKIIAETELALLRERQSGEYRSALELVLRNAQQAARTVEALVAAARQEASLERGTSDAYEPALNAAEACGKLASEHGVDVVVARPPTAMRVGAPGDLVERILQPLVENACRYGTGKVQVSIARHSTNVVYAVEDDGPGVDPEERERIFEPGARGSAGRRNGAGAGLGLALSRRLARSVNGEVVADEDGNGGRFVVGLPGG